nr:hypothetical protein [Tanacetum cinerariifolium]
MMVPQGEGTCIPTEPHHTPTPEAQTISSTTPSLSTLLSVTTAPIPTITPSDTPTLRQYTRSARIAQSSALLPIADEPASPLRDVSEGEACPTDSGFGADQDRANIAKTSTLPYDSVPRVTSPTADEDSMQQTLDKLMALCTSLQRQHSEMVSKLEGQELEINMLKARVKLLEDREGGGVERSEDDAPINGRNLDEGEATAERVSNDTEEMATVLTSMDASTVLASGVAEVSTGTRDAEIARIHAKEELQIIIDGLDRINETKSNDVVRLQAVIDRKKVIITEDSIIQALRLDDVDSVDCLPNEETFVELAKIGYEKPSTKLTFYKAFFSAQ